MKDFARKKRRKRRVRSKIRGTQRRPRLSIFRSNRGIFAQLINDVKGETLVAVSSQELKEEERKSSKVEKARSVGKLLAKKALALKINQAVFDRGGLQYHGRVKALAEGAKEEGLRI